MSKQSRIVRGVHGRTWVPISNSTTSILSAMTGGLEPLLRAALSISIASAWNWSEKRGHWNEKDIMVRVGKPMRLSQKQG